MVVVGGRVMKVGEWLCGNWFLCLSRVGEWSLVLISACNCGLWAFYLCNSESVDQKKIEISNHNAL